MAAPVLLYCVGATKAGTSWLHRYLSDHPQTYLRGVKELHYWDHPTSETCARFIDVLQRQRAQSERLGKKAAVDGREKVAANLTRKVVDLDDLIAMQNAPRDGHSAYQTYLADRAGDARLIGDLTPSYSLLDEDTLREMQNLQSGTRFIYLMRDPVARLWSHVRMMAERRAQDPSEIEARAARIFDRVLDGGEEEIAVRSDYAGALKRLNAALDPKRLLVLFYETLFSQNTIDRICTFLGLDAHPGDFDRKVLVSAGVKMTDAQRQKSAQYLAPQYAYIARTQSQLPDAWLRHMPEDH